jgi:hypothetical protein
VTVTSATGASSSDGGPRLGSAIFVQLGSSVTPLGGPLTSTATIAPSTGASGGGNGSAFGSSIFLSGPAGTITFQPRAGQPQTVSKVIADQASSGSGGGHAGTYCLPKPTECRCCHKHVFGVTTINPGTLPVAADAISAQPGSLPFGGGRLQFLSGVTTRSTSMATT